MKEKIIIAVLFISVIFCNLLLPQTEKTISTPIIASDDFIDSVGKPVVLIESEIGHGTGFFYSQEGKFVRILTCEHGIKNTKQAVIYYNKKAYLTIVIGTDSVYDLAALQIEVPDGFRAPLVEFDDSKLQKDEFVAACGYNRIIEEEELCEKTIRLGLFRKIRPIFYKEQDYEHIETDAPMREGNSGAPLFNFKGKVVGMICSAIFPELPYTPVVIDSVESSAVPTNVIKKFLSSLPEPSEVEGVN